MNRGVGVRGAVRAAPWAAVVRLAAACPVLLWASVSSAGADGRPVQLAATDGVPIAGTLYETDVRPAPAVVLVHMLGRSRGDWESVARALQATGITALAIDLRGHGTSGGATGALPAMVADVRGAVRWLAGRPGVRSDALGLAGASLGANLVVLAAAEEPLARVVAAVSPSLDYRGLRIGPDAARKLAGRELWMAASAEDPFALRTMRDLTVDGVAIEQHVSNIAGHGSRLMAADPELARALVDWLHQRLIF